MAVFDIDFAHEMAEASKAILSKPQQTNSSARAAIYTSLVACEVALKAGLEAAGVSVKKLKKLSHDLSSLLKCFDSCSVLAPLTAGISKRVPASRIRSIAVDNTYAGATIGKLIDDIQKYGASEYPSGIRYGAVLRHYPADVVSRLGETTVTWVKQHIGDIQKS